MADEAVLKAIDDLGDWFLEAVTSGLRVGANCSAEETLTAKFLKAVEAARKEFGITFLSSLLFLCLKVAIRSSMEREQNPVILSKLAFAERVVKLWGPGPEHMNRTILLASAIIHLIEAEVEAERTRDHRQDLKIELLIGLCGRATGDPVPERYLAPFLEVATREKEELLREQEEDAAIVAELEARLGADELEVVGKIPTAFPVVHKLFAAHSDRDRPYHRVGQEWRPKGKKDPFDKLVTITRARHPELMKQLLFFRMFGRSRDLRLDRLELFLNLCTLQQVSDAAFGASTAVVSGSDAVVSGK